MSAPHEPGKAEPDTDTVTSTDTDTDTDADTDETVEGDLVDHPDAPPADAAAGQHTDGADGADDIDDAETVDQAPASGESGSDTTKGSTAAPSAAPAVPPTPASPVGGLPSPTFDYTDAGVPTLDYVRDKIEKRHGTALGSAELAGATDAADRQRKVAEEREKLAAEKLAELRRQVSGEKPGGD